MGQEIKDLLVKLLEGQEELKQGQERLEQKVDKIQYNQEIFEKVVMNEFDKVNGRLDKVERGQGLLAQEDFYIKSDMEVIKKAVNSNKQ